MPCQAKLTQQGFTLIELSVVLVIVVLGFSVISINISSGNQTTQLYAISRDLVSALRYARGQALTTHHTLSLALNLSADTYQIESQNKQYRMPGEIELTAVIAQDEFKQGQTAHIRFYPDGSSSGGRITLTWGTQIAIIDINWLSGKIELKYE